MANGIEIIRWEDPPDPFLEVIAELQANQGKWAVVSEKNTKHHAALQVTKSKFEKAGCEATVRLSNDSKGDWVSLYVCWPKPKRGRPPKS